MSVFRSLQAVQSALLTGDLTCRQMVEYYLERIRETSYLNAYIEVWEEEALDKANEIDRRIHSSPSSLGKLFGAVMSLKDNICYEAHTVTASSCILGNYNASYSATAVERLVGEDVIFIGRTNCDQFGMGSSNENSIYGAVHHPFDFGRISGGSSGGAAVSVATDTCLAAVGSDTGGSIRQPAAFCGLWGIKPSYGCISRHGLIAYASSFDQIGFIGQNVDDLLLFTAVCSGPDGFDATVVPGYSLEKSHEKRLGSFRLAYFSSAIQHTGIDSGVRGVVDFWMQELINHGNSLEAVEFDLLPYVVSAYYVLTTAEASTNLSRYDGVRYGYRPAAITNSSDLYLRTRTAGFSDEVKRRILLGTYVLSSGYYEAYYTKAQQVRRLLKDRLEAILDEFDAVVLPVSPVVAWKIGEKKDDPTEMYLSDIYTVLANLCGVPAVTFQVGVHPVNGMPVGIQLMGRRFDEAGLIQIAKQITS